MFPLFNRFRRRRSRAAAVVSRPSIPFRPSSEVLEAREVPSVTSAITANFNGTAIPAGSTLWFNSAFTATGLPANAPVTIHAEHGMISFTAGGNAYNVAVPNGVVVLTPGATSASASFDPTDNDWDVAAPSNGAGDVFLDAASLAVPNGLPGGIKNVTWTADFWSDTAGVTVNWKWAASVYKNFSTDNNALNVKPVDSKTLSAYTNGDQSDTPEAFKSFLAAGGTGGGGPNYTGNFTPAKAVKPTLGDGLQDYPYPSSNPLTSVAFNESSVLKGAALDTTNGYFDVWYSDEHALALGIGSITVKTASGSTTTNYSIAQMNGDPAVAHNPAIGSTATTGDQAGTDVSGRPMAPSLFITDTTNDPNNRSGDWQWGGQAYAPSDVFGAWKSFTRTVDYTAGTTPTVSVTTSLDPAKNNWNLGAGADAVPTGLTSEGYGAEIRWNLNDMYTAGILQAGHTYRFYVIVHDGDQNKVGGDAGQASFTYTLPAATNPATISGTVTDNFGSVQVGVHVVLTGTSSTGQSVSLDAYTDNTGVYLFTNVPPGTYTVTEAPPDFPAGADANSGYTYSGSQSFFGQIDGAGGSTTSTGSTSIASITLASNDAGTQFNFVNNYSLLG
jgi:hypothetical protein